jgi:hypothetical protein
LVDHRVRCSPYAFNRECAVKAKGENSHVLLLQPPHLDSIFKVGEARCEKQSARLRRLTKPAPLYKKVPPRCPVKRCRVLRGDSR